MAGNRVTGGDVERIREDALDQWMSASDQGEPTSVLAVLAFCAATGNVEPLGVLARALGLDIMTEEDRRWRDIGRASEELENARKRLNRAKERV